jgi:hypothetical protein
MVLSQVSSSAARKLKPPEIGTSAVTLDWVSWKASISSLRLMIALIQSKCPLAELGMSFTKCSPTTALRDSRCKHACQVGV